MSIYGTGAPRFIYATGSVDYTAPTFYILKKAETDSQDILRRGIINDNMKQVAKGEYFNCEYAIPNLSKAEIDSLKQMSGKVIKFFPHSDYLVAYNAICEYVRAEKVGATALKYMTYISVLSESYQIPGDNVTGIESSYILPDGTDDYVDIPITNLGTTFSIAFNISNWDGAINNNGIISSDTNKFYVRSNYGLPNKLVMGLGDNPVDQRYTSSVEFINSTSTMKSIVVTVNVSTPACKMYLDGTEDTSVSAGSTPIADMSFTNLRLFRDKTVYTTCKFNNLIITSDIMTQTDVNNFKAGSYSSIDNQVLWYKCNDLSGNLVDSSGNNKTGVVNNVASTFYNKLYS